MNKTPYDPYREALRAEYTEKLIVPLSVRISQLMWGIWRGWKKASHCKHTVGAWSEKEKAYICMRCKAIWEREE